MVVAVQVLQSIGIQVEFILFLWMSIMKELHHIDRNLSIEGKPFDIKVIYYNTKIGYINSVENKKMFSGFIDVKLEEAINAKSWNSIEKMLKDIYIHFENNSMDESERYTISDEVEVNVELANKEIERHNSYVY